jgi:hydroxymethylbilane synthase
VPSCQILRIATRKSPLALWQAEHLKARLQTLFPLLQIELIGVQTEGDRFLDARLGSIGGKGVFIKELEEQLLEGKADLAVHSMKDVTVSLPRGLVIGAILSREDPRDALVSHAYRSLPALPHGARVGTSSLRRQCQLRYVRPDLKIGELRGNVGTRLGRLDRGDYDAIILAAAGLMRLQLHGRIGCWLDPDYMLPAIGQGAIGVECRADDASVLELLRAIDDAPTRVCVTAERALNEGLGGGCHVPVAGFAELSGGQLHLRALVGRVDGSALLKAEARGPARAPQALGHALAENLLARGAAALLRG